MKKETKFKDILPSLEDAENFKETQKNYSYRLLEELCENIKEKYENKILAFIEVEYDNFLRKPLNQKLSLTFKNSFIRHEFINLGFYYIDRDKYYIKVNGFRASVNCGKAFNEEELIKIIQNILSDTRTVSLIFGELEQIKIMEKKNL